MKSLDDYQAEAIELVKRDVPLRAIQQGLQRMTHLEYQAPASLAKLEWFRTYRSTQPYDALRGATRALASLDERIRIDPVSVVGSLSTSDDESALARRTANEWERCLKWNLEIGRA